MEDTLVFLCVIASAAATAPGIQMKSYSQSWPPVVYGNLDSFSLGNIDAELVECAGRCLRTSNCSSFLYKQTDTPQKNCFNTLTSYMYTGKINTALGGVPCDAWASNHVFRQNISDEMFPDGSINSAENYCRDPFMNGMLWCPLVGGVGGLLGLGVDTCNIQRCMSTRCSLLSDNFRTAPKVKIEDDIVFYSIV